MTKTKSIILCLVILIAIFSGCSKQETISKSELQTSTTNAITNEITAEQETSESETTTQKSDNSETTVANKTKPAEQKSAGQNTTKKVTTTQKQTTTKRQTTKKVTTIQKPTTHKVTTTKKPTTTKGAPTKHTHTMPCGNVGKWYSSKDAFMSDYYAEADYWNNKLDNDEISYEEYISKVPRGHEVWQCSCGKWTGNYKYK